MERSRCRGGLRRSSAPIPAALQTSRRLFISGRRRRSPAGAKSDVFVETAMRTGRRGVLVRSRSISEHRRRLRRSRRSRRVEDWETTSSNQTICASRPSESEVAAGGQYVNKTESAIRSSHSDETHRRVRSKPLADAKWKLRSPTRKNRQQRDQRSAKKNSPSCREQRASTSSSPAANTIVRARSVKTTTTVLERADRRLWLPSAAAPAQPRQAGAHLVASGRGRSLLERSPRRLPWRSIPSARREIQPRALRSSDNGSTDGSHGSPKPYEARRPHRAVMQALRRGNRAFASSIPLSAQSGCRAGAQANVVAFMDARNPALRKAASNGSRIYNYDGIQSSVDTRNRFSWSSAWGDLPFLRPLANWLPCAPETTTDRQIDIAIRQ